MSNDSTIEDLLKQDEEALKAKRKRLNTFAKALAEVRTATENAAAAAQQILDGGDLTRTEVARVFELSKSERSALVPPARRRQLEPTAEETTQQKDHANSTASDSY